MTPAGFPHSDISGSKPAYDSPKLFAVNHVLHRLLAPRHPPYALYTLTFLRCFYYQRRIAALSGRFSSVTYRIYAPSLQLPSALRCLLLAKHLSYLCFKKTKTTPGISAISFVGLITEISKSRLYLYALGEKLYYYIIRTIM